MPASMKSLRRCTGFAFTWNLSIKAIQMLRVVTHPVRGGSLRSCAVKLPHSVTTQRWLSSEPLKKGGNYDAQRSRLPIATERADFKKLKNPYSRQET